MTKKAYQKARQKRVKVEEGTDRHKQEESETAQWKKRRKSLSKKNKENAAQQKQTIEKEGSKRKKAPEN
jgi:hypothetical protein